MIRLTTLGTFRIDAQGAELPTAGMQPKRLALLAYLAAARPPGAHRRDTMLALLWPELDQERARSALRQALHALRRSLGPNVFLTTGNEAIALDRAAVSCDLWDLDDAAAAGDDRTVATLFAGELAAGLFVGNAPAFEQWLDGERARVCATVRASAWRQADAAATAVHSAECVQSARLALSLSELDEGAVRRAMRLVASVGERATALAFYEAFTTTLRRELDAEPSAVTQAVADEVRRGEPTISEPRAVPDGPVRQAVPREAQAVVRRSGGDVAVRRVAAAAVVAVIAVAAAARLAPSATSSLDPRRVVVEEFASESTSPMLDTLAHAVTLSTRQSLVRLDNVQLLSARDESGPAHAMDGAGTVVRGAVRSAGDSIELRAEVVDRRTGAVSRTVVTRVPSDAGSRASNAATLAFGDRVSAMVATALYPGWGSALSQPPSYTGYRAFVDGMRSIRRERHDLAVASFRQAYEEDSSFTAAGLLAGMEYYQMRRYASAESVVTTIAARRAMLPVVDGHLLDWLQRSLGGDRIGARSAMAAVAAAAPTADLAWLQLAIDNVETARPVEALAALDRIDPNAEFGEGWVAYWATRIEALHIAGSHARELAVTREALRGHPEFRVLVAYELRTLAALGRTADVERIAATLIAAPEAGGLDPRIALRQAAVELAAHGNPAASRRVLAHVRAWYASRPEVERVSLPYELSLARTAYLLDDRREARRLYQAVLQEHPKCLDCIGALGVLAARDGNRAAADSGSIALAAVSRPFLFGRPLEWQARIAAASGDRARAVALQAAAFAGGAEFDVMTHADPDLRALRPDSIYRAFARVER